MLQLALIVVLGVAVHENHLWFGGAMLLVILIRKMPLW